MQDRGLNIPTQQLIRESWENRILIIHDDPATGRLDGGVRPVDIGQLSMRHGFQTRMVWDGHADQLEGAVEARSREALVTVDSGILWYGGRRDDNLHTVYVTGVERGPSGAVVGYYINDTGTGETARFVDAELFNMAWRTPVAGGQFVEIR